MQSHHAVDPVLVQPHVPDPHLLHHQLFRCVLIRLPHCCLHSSPSCLHSSPTCSSPSRTHLLPLHLHPPPHSQSSSRSSNKQASLLSAPISLSSSSAHPLGVQLCWLCGGPFSPLSVCTYWSLCPRAREQCTGHRRKVEEGTCHSLLLLQGPPCPSSSHSPQWVHLTIYESPCHL